MKKFFMAGVLTLLLALLCVPSALCAENSAYCVSINGALESTLSLTNTAEAQNVRIIGSVTKDGIMLRAKMLIVSLPAHMDWTRRVSFSVPYNEANGEIVSVFAVDANLSPMITPLSSQQGAKKLALSGSEVWATAQPEAENGVTNVVDSSLNTIWSASEVSKENPQSVTAVLREMSTVTNVGIAFGLGKDRVYSYSVWASEDGENFTDLTGWENSEKTNDMQYLPIEPTKAKYIRYTIRGRDSLDSAWIQVSEIEIYGKEEEKASLYNADFSSLKGFDISKGTDSRLGNDLYAEAAISPRGAESLHIFDNVSRHDNIGVKEARVISVSATSEVEPQNVAANIIDGSLLTKWTASDVSETAPQSVTVKLDAQRSVSSVALAFGLGTKRTHIFSVDASRDGIDFTNILPKTNSVSSDALIRYAVSQSACQYLRFNFYGRTDVTAGWIQLTEACAYYDEAAADGMGYVTVSRSLEECANDYSISFDALVAQMSYSREYNAIASLGSAVNIAFSYDNGKTKISLLGGDTLYTSFTNTFAFNTPLSFKVDVFPALRTASVSVQSSSTYEKRYIYFTDAGSGVRFESGAAGNVDMYISNLCAMQSSVLTTAAAQHERVRLESKRLTNDPVSSSEYFGRFVNFDNSDLRINSSSEKNLFIKRPSFIGSCAVAFESVDKPGYFLVTTDNGVEIAQYAANASFYACSAFTLSNEDDAVLIRSYRNSKKYLCDVSTNRKSGMLSLSETATPFYVRGEDYTVPLDAVTERFRGDYYRIIPYSEDKSVAVEGESSDSGAKIITTATKYTDSQRWEFIPRGRNLYTITNKKSDKSFDLPSSNKSEGKNLTQYTTSLSASNQGIELIASEKGGYLMRMAHSSLYLTAKDGYITQEKLTNDANQRFKISFVAKNTSLPLGTAFTSFILEGEDIVSNVKLMWNNVSNATSYEILRSENGGSFALIQKTSAVTIDDYDLSLGNRYSYLVKAYNGTSLIAIDETEEFLPYVKPSGLSTYSNLSQSSLNRPNSLCVDGVYYKFSSKSRTDGGSGFGRLMVKTSTDDVTYGNEKEVLNINDILSSPGCEDMSGCRFEGSCFYYNPRTNKIFWFGHFEAASGYGVARVSIAYGTPGERFESFKAFRPTGNDARDMSIFIDDDNSAYMLAAINGNSDLALYKLTADWTDVEKRICIVNDGKWREAPSILKHDGLYYLFSSGTAGWYPTQCMYNMAPSMDGPWTSLRRVANRNTFSSQSNNATHFRPGSDITILTTYRWMSNWKDATVRRNITRLMPITTANGYAFFDFFDKIFHSYDKDILIPVQSGRLLSQEKSASASSSTNNASRANDGDYQTSWTATKEWPSTWSVDLGEEHALSEIQISWATTVGEEAYYQYTIEGSSDGVNYTVLCDKSNSYTDYGFTTNALSGSARYVRLNILNAKLRTTTENTYTPQIYEVKIFGK